MANIIENLIQSLSKLNLVRRPKKGENILELTEAITLLKRNKDIIPVGKEKEVLDLILDIHDKFPAVRYDANNQDFKKVCQHLIDTVEQVDAAKLSFSHNQTRGK